MTCELVKQLITEWSRTRERPFPYLKVGDHLASCTSCLAWSTEIAYHPGDHYVRSLRLRLSEVLSYLGSSLLAVWSNDQDVKIRFCVEPGSLPDVRKRALGFLRRYAGFNPETKDEAARIRQMIPNSGKGAVMALLEPYELTRYFFQAAYEAAGSLNDEARMTNVRTSDFGLRTSSGADLLVNLGIVENYQAQSELAAGHEEQANAHFQQARGYFGQVIAMDVSRCAEQEKTSLISARINLAGTEVQQNRYSEVSLHRAIDLLYEARRLIPELGQSEVEFTSIFSNLLISYLRLYLDYGIDQGYTQARELAADICGAHELAPVFLKECIREGADPELTGLLAKPAVGELADYLKRQSVVSSEQ